MNLKLSMESAPLPVCPGREVKEDQEFAEKNGDAYSIRGIHALSCHF